MRVGHAVENDEERLLAALLRQSQHVVHRLIRIGGNDRDQALMPRCHRIQMRTIHFLNDNLLLTRHRNDFTRRANQFALRNEQLLHVASRLECFADGVAAYEQIALHLLFLRGRRRHGRTRHRRTAVIHRAVAVRTAFTIRAVAIRTAFTIIRTLTVRTAFTIVRTLAIRTALAIIRAVAVRTALTGIRTVAIRTALAAIRTITVGTAVTHRTVAIRTAFAIIRTVAIRTAFTIVRTITVRTAFAIIRTVAIGTAFAAIRTLAIRTASVGTAILFAVALRTQGFFVIAPIVTRTARFLGKLIVISHCDFLPQQLVQRVFGLCG